MSVRELIDEYVDLERRQLKILEELGEQGVNECGRMSEVHLWQGIETVSEETGEPLQEIPFINNDGSRYTKRKLLNYGGVVFYQLAEQ